MTAAPGAGGPEPRRPADPAAGARGLAARLELDPGPANAERAVSEGPESLILDLLEWIGPGRRPYAEVIEAWRTSCPRLPVWEDANELGFITRSYVPGRGSLVSVSPRGREHLRSRRSAAPR